MKLNLKRKGLTGVYKLYCPDAHIREAVQKKLFSMGYRWAACNEPDKTKIMEYDYILIGYTDETILYAGDRTMSVYNTFNMPQDWDAAFIALKEIIAPTEIKIQLKGYDLTFYPDGSIQFGCTKLSSNDVKNVLLTLEAAKKL